MRSLFKVVLLSILLVASSNAKDLLDLATNGAANNSEIKALSDNDMIDIKGGYYFYRYPSFDFYGGVTSFAYIVLEDDKDTLVLPGSSTNKILLAMTRQVNGKQEFYINTYDLTTKERGVYIGSQYHKMIDEFRAQLGK